MFRDYCLAVLLSLWSCLSKLGCFIPQTFMTGHFVMTVYREIGKNTFTSGKIGKSHSPLVCFVSAHVLISMSQPNDLHLHPQGAVTPDRAGDVAGTLDTRGLFNSRTDHTRPHRSLDADDSPPSPYPVVPSSV